LALQQGREVFAVPGKMDSATSFGTNSLIKQGAKLISNTDDIIEELAIKLKKFSDSQEKENDKKESTTLGENTSLLDTNTKSVYDILSREPMYIDEIINLTKIDISQISSILMKLQLSKMVKELPGKNFARI
jgi:DNA processing protein